MGYSNEETSSRFVILAGGPLTHTVGDNLPAASTTLHLITPNKLATNNELLGFTYTRPGPVARTDEVESARSFPMLNLRDCLTGSTGLFDDGEEEESDELFGKEEDSDTDMI